MTATTAERGVRRPPGQGADDRLDERWRYVEAVIYHAPHRPNEFVRHAIGVHQPAHLRPQQGERMGLFVRAEQRDEFDRPPRRHCTQRIGGALPRQRVVRTMTSTSCSVASLATAWWSAVSHRTPIAALSRVLQMPARWYGLGPTLQPAYLAKLFPEHYPRRHILNKVRRHAAHVVCDCQRRKDRSVHIIRRFD